MNINIIISSCTISQFGITVELLVFYDRDSYLWHGPLQGYNALTIADKDSGAFNRSAYWYNKNLHTAETSLLGGAVGVHLPPSNVAWVRIMASTPYMGWVCCWFPSLPWEVFPRVDFSFPLSLKTNTSNSIWNAQTRFSRFLRTPKCSVGKQITIYNFFRGCLTAG